MPTNDAINSGAEHLVTAPGLIKPSEHSCANSSVILNLIVNHLLVDSSILLKASPDVAGDVVKSLSFVVKAMSIPGKPYLPHCETSQQGPHRGESTKSSWESLGKDTVMPVEEKIDRGIIKAPLNIMKKCRAPLPSITGQVALPKAMEDGFQGARAKGARRVDVLVDHLPPFINGDGFMPNAPDKGRFLLSLLGSPGVFPVNHRIPR